MTESEAISPWGPRPEEAAQPPEAAAPAPAARPASPVRALIWAALSTALLALFVGWQLGWLAAVAIVFGVFVHELGHVLVINWAGCGPSSIRIIPFLGGAATMRRAPDSDFKGVLIALAGPAMGLAAALPFFAAAQATHERAWLAGAFFIGVLNFVNLAPAPPLDGSKALGPVLSRIHPLLERAALLAVGLAAVAWGISHHSYLFSAFIAMSVLATALNRQIRPPARPLALIEWLVALALYAAVLGLAALVIGGSLGGALPERLASFFRFGG